MKSAFITAMLVNIAAHAGQMEIPKSLDFKAPVARATSKQDMDLVLAALKDGTVTSAMDEAANQLMSTPADNDNSAELSKEVLAAKAVLEKSCAVVRPSPANYQVPAGEKPIITNSSKGSLKGDACPVEGKMESSYKITTLELKDAQLLYGKFDTTGSFTGEQKNKLISREIKYLYNLNSLSLNDAKGVLTYSVDTLTMSSKTPRYSVLLNGVAKTLMKQPANGDLRAASLTTVFNGTLTVSGTTVAFDVYSKDSRQNVYVNGNKIDTTGIKNFFSLGK